jgi:hemoglobin
MSEQNQITPYKLIGGDAGVRQLVDRFYDLMDAQSETAELRAMHPVDLSGSREKLYDFLCGWFGGPPRFAEKHGHPRLRARHLPFVVDQQARDQWLQCMNQALDETGLDVMVKTALKQSFFNMADHLRNEREHGIG